MAVSSAGKGRRDEQKTLAATKEDLKQRQHEDCMTKYHEVHLDRQEADKKLHSAENEEQNVFDSESRSDLSFTVQKDTEVIHREVTKGTKINCDLKENQSEISETRRLKDSTKKHSARLPEREPRYTLCDIDYTSEDGKTQTNLTPFGRDRLSNDAGPTCTRTNRSRRPG